VLAFSAGALLLAVVVSGVWPALHAVRLNISDVLKQTQGVTMRRRGWQQKGLVISQIAVSVALFGVAVLFLPACTTPPKSGPPWIPQEVAGVVGIRSFHSARWLVRPGE